MRKITQKEETYNHKLLKETVEICDSENIIMNIRDESIQASYTRRLSLGDDRDLKQRGK